MSSLAYVPTPGPLPGAQYVPSNGTEGHNFLENFCSNCARDRSIREGVHVDECDDSELCPIIGASFRGEAVEWRELETGECFCTAFVEAGQEVAAPRCSFTIDMFSDQAQPSA